MRVSNRIAIVCALFLLAIAAAACEGAGGSSTDTGGGGGGTTDTTGGGTTDTTGGGSTDPDMGKTFTQTITAAEGGQLSTDSGVATLDVPAGALAADTELTVTVGEGNADTASAIYEFGPDGQVFEQPVTLTIMYEGDPGEGNQAVIAVKDGDTWTAIAGSSRDGVRVSAPVEHFSAFAIIITAAGAVQKGECSELADTFNACGGDVVGTWTIDTLCIYWDPNDNPLAGPGSPFEQCPELVFGVTVDWVGTYVVDATTVTTNLDQVISHQHWEIPLSCFGEGVTCAMLDENMDEATCVDDGTSCTCDGEQIQGDGMQMVQTYVLEGNTFVSTTEEGTVSRLDYCVQGGDAIFRALEPEGGWQTGSPEWIVLKKQ